MICVLLGPGYPQTSQAPKGQEGLAISVDATNGEIGGEDAGKGHPALTRLYT